MALNRNRARYRVPKNQKKRVKKKSFTRMTTNQTKTMKMTVSGTRKLKLTMKLPRLNQERAPARHNIRGQLGEAQDGTIHIGYAAASTKK